MRSDELPTRLATMDDLEFAVQHRKVSLVRLLRGDLWFKQFLIVQYI